MHVTYNNSHFQIYYSIVDKALKTKAIMFDRGVSNGLFTPNDFGKTEVFYEYRSGSYL